MKYVTLSLCLCALAAYGQSSTPATPTATPQAVSPDTVVLKIGDKPMTAAEFAKLLRTFPPEYQQAAKSNPKQVMQSYFLIVKLAKQAEEEKLDQVSPVKEALELQRMQALATAVVNRYQVSIPVTDEDIQKHYEAEKDKKYSQAKIRGIFIQFGPRDAITAQVDMSKDPKASLPTNLRTEDAAKTLAEDIVKQSRAGTDFAELAKTKSDDKQTGAKGGEFPLLRQTDRMPENIKQAVFALKPGEVSDPIRAANGYYIVKVEERSVEPLAEVKQAVSNDVRQERFQKWASDQQKEFEVTVESPTYFGGTATAPHAAVIPSQQVPVTK
jgi:peptidyl-prolyl cis-trans isomerase C